MIVSKIVILAIICIIEASERGKFPVKYAPYSGSGKASKIHIYQYNMSTNLIDLFLEEGQVFAIKIGQVDPNEAVAVEFLKDIPFTDFCSHRHADKLFIYVNGFRPAMQYQIVVKYGINSHEIMSFNLLPPLATERNCTKQQEAWTLDGCHKCVCVVLHNTPVKRCLLPWNYGENCELTKRHDRRHVTDHNNCPALIQKILESQPNNIGFYLGVAISICVIGGLIFSIYLLTKRVRRSRRTSFQDAAKETNSFPLHDMVEDQEPRVAFIRYQDDIDYIDV